MKHYDVGAKPGGKVVLNELHSLEPHGPDLVVTVGEAPAP